jgi:hypothetical protein
MKFKISFISLFFVGCATGNSTGESLAAFISMPEATSYGQIKDKFGFPIETKRTKEGATNLTILAYQFDEYRCEVKMAGMESFGEPACHIDLAAHVASEKEADERMIAGRAAAAQALGQSLSAPINSSSDCVSYKELGGAVRTKCK